MSDELESVDGLRAVRTMVYGRNSNGDPDIWFAIIHLPVEGYDMGEHYDAAAQAAESEGYDVDRNGAFDTEDVLGRRLEHLFVWASASHYDKDGAPWSAEVDNAST